MKIISIVLAFIAFGMCFFGWHIIFFGPILITFCAVISIIIASVTLNKDNDKMLHVLSIIISSISILIAVIFLGLQIYLYTIDGLDYQKSTDEYNTQTLLKEAKEIELGSEVEIEDGLFITVNDIYYDTTINSITINYDIKNETREDIRFNQNMLYYTSNTSIEPTYIQTTIIEPILIPAGTNLVAQQSTLQIDEEVNSLGYTNSKGDSFQIPITTN